MKEFSEFKQSVGDMLEAVLATFIDSLEVVEPLKSACHYALFPRGKRLRPLLACAVCVDLGGNVEALLRPALALELVHASSLVHDDLPALDNDDFRRGRPSCHKQFGEATAILTGDLLIAAAFSLVSDDSIAIDKQSQMIAALSKSFIDVCHGQQRDLMHGEERGALELLHRLKTGALFRAATRFGAIAAISNSAVIDQLSRYGEDLGVVFQILDDLIDLKGNEEVKGRPAGSDERNHRETFGTESNARALEDKLSAMRGELEGRLSEVETATGMQMTLTRAIQQQIAG